MFLAVCCLDVRVYVDFHGIKNSTATVYTSFVGNSVFVSFILDS